MLDKRIFVEQMATLADRFGRTVSAPVVNSYFEALSNSLTDEEFLSAAKRIFNESTYWPSPAEFVDKAKGRVEDAAQLEWMELMSAVANDRKQQLSESGKAALEAVGGRYAVRSSLDISFIRRDFIAAYVAFERRDRSEKAVPALENGKVKALAESVLQN